MRDEILKNKNRHSDQDRIDDPEPFFAVLYRKRIHQEYDKQRKTHVQRQLEPRLKGAVQLDPQLENKPENGNCRECPESPFGHCAYHLTDLGILVLFVGKLLRKLLRETMPWIHIVILSGCSDFAYAKQAISLGVEEYLLKPVSVKDLTEVLERIRAKIDQDRLSLAGTRLLQKRMMSRMRFVRDQLLRSLLSSQMTQKEAESTKSEMMNLGINLQADYYTVLDITCTFPDGDVAKTSDGLTELADGNGGQILVCGFPKGARALVMGGTEKETEERAYRFASSVVYTLEKEGGSNVLVTIGQICQSLTDVSESARTASHVYHLLMNRQEPLRRQVVGVKDVEDIPVSLESLQIEPLYERLQYVTLEEFPDVFREYVSSLRTRTSTQISPWIFFGWRRS